MNSKIFRQYEGAWAKKPYPGKGYTVSGAGCGLVALTHAAIEQEAKKNWTPETLRKYMIKKGYVTYGNGTTWNGMYQTMKYLGYADTKWITEAMPMKDAFTELNKGNRIGIILFYGGYSKRKKKWYRTPDGTVWTGSGHYIFFGDYKVVDGKHWFNLKDSGGRKHDGWYCDEKSMKGCVGQLFIASRVGTQVTPKKAVKKDGSLAIDGVGGIGTVKSLQRFLGCTQDGVISSQNKNAKKFFPAFKSIEFEDKPAGSVTVHRLQDWLGVASTGLLNETTIKYLQKRIKVKDDGVFGPESMKALQKYLNDNSKATAVIPDCAKAKAMVAEAKKYCWPADTAKSKWAYKTGSAIALYKSQLKRYMGKTSKKALSDCGYFVTTCARAVGFGKFLALKGNSDPFPAVPDGMFVVFSGGKIPANFLRPGDIVRYKKTSGSQHTYMYYNYGYIAEGGREIRFPVIQKDTMKCNSSNVKHSTIQVIRAE